MSGVIRGMPKDWKPVARAFEKDGFIIEMRKSSHLTWHAPAGKVFSGLSSGKSGLLQHLKQLKAKGWDYELSKSRGR